MTWTLNFFILYKFFYSKDKGVTALVTLPPSNWIILSTFLSLVGILKFKVWFSMGEIRMSRWLVLKSGLWILEFVLSENIESVLFFAVMVKSSLCTSFKHWKCGLDSKKDSGIFRTLIKLRQWSLHILSNDFRFTSSGTKYSSPWKKFSRE